MPGSVMKKLSPILLLILFCAAFDCVVSASWAAKLGSEFQVNTYTPDEQREARTAALSSGGFVVVWTSEGQDGAYSGVYGQVFRADRSRLGLEFRVNTTVAGPQSEPSVVGLPNGGFVVVWTSQAADGYTYVFGQRFAMRGVKVGGEFQVNTTEKAEQDT